MNSKVEIFITKYGTMLHDIPLSGILYSFQMFVEDKNLDRCDECISNLLKNDAENEERG